MYYQSELTFLQQIIKNFQINSWVIPAINLYFSKYDMGLRKMIFGESGTDDVHSFPIEILPNHIYRVLDYFDCTYLILLLPDTDNTQYLLIGPYQIKGISRNTLLSYVEKLHLAPNMVSTLEKFYLNLPTLVDESVLLTLINTFGEKIWGSMNNFSIEYMDSAIPENLESITSRSDEADSEDSAFRMQILMERYANENRMIDAISHGQTHKAEIMILSHSIQNMEQRIANPLRNTKNFMIILNTLMRKAVETASVHPLHIDTLSSRFAKKIEQVNNIEDIPALQREMIHKYCLLVKNHSLKGYSYPIQQVITYIDADLTSDLSLNTQAKLLNVNASYLSTLFKKETGQTLTDYVNYKRMQHAIFLLNSTNMQIQTIAQYCGIMDVNYFTKIFKKYNGKTPKEYRNSITPMNSKTS